MVQTVPEVARTSTSTYISTTSKGESQQMYTYYLVPVLVLVEFTLKHEQILYSIGPYKYPVLVLAQEIELVWILKKKIKDRRQTTLDLTSVCIPFFRYTGTLFYNQTFVMIDLLNSSFSIFFLFLICTFCFFIHSKNPKGITKKRG